MHFHSCTCALSLKGDSGGEEGDDVPGLLDDSDSGVSLHGDMQTEGDGLPWALASSSENTESEGSSSEVGMAVLRVKVAERRVDVRWVAEGRVAEIMFPEKT
jgi:hypothetical protein